MRLDRYIWNIISINPHTITRTKGEKLKYGNTQVDDKIIRRPRWWRNEYDDRYEPM